MIDGNTRGMNRCEDPPPNPHITGLLAEDLIETVLKYQGSFCHLLIFEAQWFYSSFGKERENAQFPSCVQLSMDFPTKGGQRSLNVAIFHPDLGIGNSFDPFL